MYICYYIDAGLFCNIFGQKKGFVKMVHYDYIREECSDSETGDYISYAIIAVRIKENDGAVTAEEICTVHDVFLNESRAREFVGICNELGLSPVHIYDAVQDAIG